jgi:type II secretory pathway component GspD/PulD (secretin)
MLRALQNDGRLEIISRPQIMTLDGRTARVQVGENFPYVGEVSISEIATTPIVSFQNIGVILTVKPNITPDDRIYLEIVPEVSELKELVNVQQISTTTGTVTQQAPRITITNANTVVSVNDGQTVVLGGLIQKRHTDFMRKIPWLGDLPYLGCLFRYTQEREFRQELLIIMTPHIVRSEADAQRIKDIELARSNWILCHTPEIHGDIGFTQPDPVMVPGVEVVPHDLGQESGLIQPMSGEEPLVPPGPPADWAIPAAPQTEPKGQERRRGRRVLFR